MNTNTLQSVQSNNTGLDNTVYFIGQDLHSNNVYVTVMVNRVCLEFCVWEVFQGQSS